MICITFCEKYAHFDVPVVVTHNGMKRTNDRHSQNEDTSVHRDWFYVGWEMFPFSLNDLHNLCKVATLEVHH